MSGCNTQKQGNGAALVSVCCVVLCVCGVSQFNWFPVVCAYIEVYVSREIGERMREA